MPAELLKEFLRIVEKNKSVKNIAIVIDARGREFMKTINKDLSDMKHKFKLQIVFFESNLEAVTKRFKESRLKHPLALKGTIKNGFQQEQKFLNNLRQLAHITIDTSSLNIHSLKLVIHKKLIKQKQHFTINLLSFGFKYGVPDEADLIFDMRFLSNPYFDPKLRDKNGKSKVVQNYVYKSENAKETIKKTFDYIDFVTKKFDKEGKSYLTIGIGCTGGKHRSVAITEKLSKLIKGKVTVLHRDITVD